jgi:hypothetical protein
MNNLGRPNTIDNRKAPPASSVNQVPHLRAPIADDYSVGSNLSVGSNFSFRSKTSVGSDINRIFDSNTGGGEIHNIECTDTKETIPTQATTIPQNAIRSGSKRNTPEDKDKYKNNQSIIRIDDKTIISVRKNRAMTRAMTNAIRNHPANRQFHEKIKSVAFQYKENTDKKKRQNIVNGLIKQIQGMGLIFIIINTPEEEQGRELLTGEKYRKIRYFLDTIRPTDNDTVYPDSSLKETIPQNADGTYTINGKNTEVSELLICSRDTRYSKNIQNVNYNNLINDNVQKYSTGDNNVKKRIVYDIYKKIHCIVYKVDRNNNITKTTPLKTRNKIGDALRHRIQTSTQAIAIPQNAIRSGSKRNTPEDKYINNQSFILGQTEYDSDDGGGKMSPNEPASMKRK